MNHGDDFGNKQLQLSGGLWSHDDIIEIAPKVVELWLQALEGYRYRLIDKTMILDAELGEFSTLLVQQGDDAVDTILLLDA
jgi:hypothetical protein